MPASTTVDIREEAEKLVRLVEGFAEAERLARRIDDLAQEDGQLCRFEVTVSEEARSIASLIADEHSTFSPELVLAEARDLLDLIDLARKQRDDA